MKRSEKYENTKYFVYDNVNPKKRITGDCVFRAFSLAMRQPYNQTVMEMAELMCKTGYALNDKKGEENYAKLKHWEKIRQPRHENGKKYTGKEFCEALQKWLSSPDTHGCEWKDNIIIAPRIIAHIGGNHVVAIVNGQIHDTWDSSDGCIGNYWIPDDI